MICDEVRTPIVYVMVILQVDCCIRCLAQGVKAAHIIDGRSRHGILMELLTDEGVGTMIVG